MADPVDCTTGDFTETATDVRIPGVGPGLDLARTYNSLDASTEGPFGYGWSCSYCMALSVDQSTAEATVAQENGSTVVFEPDGSGGFFAPYWEDATLVQNGDGTYTFTRRGTAVFTFSSSGQLTALSDLAGDTTSLTHNGTGQLTTVTDASGRTLSLSYGSNGLVSQMTDPMGRTTTYGYNSSGDLMSVTDPMGRVTSFGYDSSGDHLLTKITKPNAQPGGPDAGNVTTNVYNASGQVTSQTDPLGRTTTWSYGTDSTTITDPDGNVTVENFDSNGELTSIAKGSSTWTYAYDPVTLALSSLTDPNGHTTNSIYDANGNVVSKQNALGKTWTYSYDALDDQTCAATPLASSPCSSLSPPASIPAGATTIAPPASIPPPYVTYSQYDTDGNLIWTTTGAYQPGSSSASYSRTTYDLYNGQSVTIGGTADSCTTSAPSNELPCATIDANGTVTQLTYDSAGDLTSSATPDGNGSELAETTSTYDADGEQTSVVSPDGNLSGANAANYATTKSYDADGELTSVTLGGASGHTVVPRTTSYTYDADGNLTSTKRSTSIERIGTTTGANSGSSLTLALPKGSLPGDEVVLSTTISPPASFGTTTLAAGGVTTIAGTGVAGSSGDGGAATAAELASPARLVVDPAGDVYVAGYNNNRVMELAATTHSQWGIAMTAGDLYTVLGSSSGASGTSGDGGPGTSALLDGPDGLALDANGDLFVSDYDNGRVQELAATTHSDWGISMTDGDVYTVAGDPTYGSWGTSGDGGAATSALLGGPASLAFDSAGDLYIADSNNNRVQEIAASSGAQWGQSMTANDIYTVAGDASGSSGSSGDAGAATSALLNTPEGVALDAAGDLYIVDSANNRVQEVAASSGTEWGQSMSANDVYTVLGDASGSSGATGDGGAATSALLDYPSVISVDTAGDLYVADEGNNRTQEVAASSGTKWGQSMTADDAYTVAGSSSGSSGYSGDGGPATSALLAGPSGLALDSSGDLFIADSSNNRVREVVASATEIPLAAGDLTTIAGTGTSGTSGDAGAARSAGLNAPYATLTDGEGNLYVADQGNDRIQEIAGTDHTQWGIAMTAGDVYTIAGSATGSDGASGDGGAATSALLEGPGALALDAAGDLFIADTWNHRVQEVAASDHTQFGISMTADDIYTVAGSASGESGSSGLGGPATSATFGGVEGIALDAAGNLYVSDQGNNRVDLVAASSCSSGCPFGLSSTTAGDVYNIAGSSSGSAGTSGDNGAATSALLDTPGGIALDASGNLYVADSENSRVQLVAATSCTSGCPFGLSSTSEGDVYTVAGSADGAWGYTGDGGPATGANLNYPTGVALDPAGDLYVDDAGNDRAQEVPASSGTEWGQSMTANDVYTVAGTTGTSGYSGDGGPASAAELSEPDGIALDAAGNLFIADTGNNVVREALATAGSGSDTVSTPSGFSLLDERGTGRTTTEVFTHTIGSSESSVTIDYSTSDPKVATLAVYRGVKSTSPIDATSDGATGSGTSLTAASVATSDSGDLLVLLAGAGQQASDATWSPPGGMTARASTHLSGLSDVIADGPGPIPAGGSGSETSTTSVSGQLAGVLVALQPGQVTSSTAYDADDEATLATDPDGNQTLTCYDGDGNVAEVVPPVGVAASSLTASSCPSSYPTDYGDRLASDATTTAYDALGNKTTVTTPAPAGHSGHETTTYAYDPAGQLTSVSSPPSSDTSGAADQVTSYTYDAAGELLTTTTGDGTAAASTTSYCYDPDGDETATVAPDGNASSIASCSSSSPWQTSSSCQTGDSYDSLGELVSETRPATSAAPSGQTTTTTYDANGNALTSEDPDGVTTTSTYTPLDQLATVSYSDSTHEVAYTYDADGNRTEMTDASGTSDDSYDPFGELTSTTNGAGKTVGYAYDALGDKASVTYPLGSGATWAASDAVTYRYDPASQLTSVTDFNGNTTTVTNTADGLASSVSLGNSGDSVSTSYDATDSPSSINLDQGSTTLLGFSYADAPSAANLAETDTPSSSSSPAAYSYDAQSRVTSMTPGSGSALSYGFDASGNLTTLPTGASGTYDNASELTSSTLSGTTTDYTYSAAGERTQATQGSTMIASATYDGAKNLTSYSDGAANMSAVTYDGDGLRASATTTPSGGSASTAHFVWDTTASVPNLLMDSTNAYISASGAAPLEQVDLSTGAVSYLVTDSLGSVRGVVNSSGGLTASTGYDAWGNPESSGGLTSETPFGFAGAYTDPSGLIYLVNRYYDPGSGQFLRVDPLVDETGQAYAYTGDDPVNATDPMGLTDCGWNPICYVGSGIDKTNNALNSGVNWASNQVNTAVCQFAQPGGLLSGWIDQQAGCGSGNSASPASSSQSSSVCSTSSSSGVAAGTASLNFGDPSQAPGPGWEWRGTGPPGSNKGSWYNPSTDQSLHPDLDHPGPIGPHYDYKGPDTGGKSIRLYPGEEVPEVQPVPEVSPTEGFPVDGF